MTTKTKTRRGRITEWVGGRTVHVELLDSGEIVTALVPRPPAKKCQCEVMLGDGSVPRIVGYVVDEQAVRVSYAEEPDEP